MKGNKKGMAIIMTFHTSQIENSTPAWGGSSCRRKRKMYELKIKAGDPAEDPFQLPGIGYTGLCVS